jgi:hypothetical protein
MQQSRADVKREKTQSESGGARTTRRAVPGALGSDSVALAHSLRTLGGLAAVELRQLGERILSGFVLLLQLLALLCIGDCLGRRRLGGGGKLLLEQRCGRLELAAACLCLLQPQPRRRARARARVCALHRVGSEG